MSQENVEIVRRLVDAWIRRDPEAMLALANPGIEYVNAPTAVEPGTQHGHDGFPAVVRAQWEFASDAHTEIQRIYDTAASRSSSSRIFLGGCREAITASRLRASSLGRLTMEK